MERGKSSKKKANCKNRKPQNPQIQKGSDWKPGGGNKSYSNLNDPDDKTIIPKRSLQQPESRLAALDGIWQETNVGQDFETLANAPLSAHGHFVFKSEKNWTLDASEYDDFFSIDVKDLATIIQSIPYHEYIGVDKKYFTKDELTEINNAAENGRKVYERLLDTLKKKETESAYRATISKDDTRIFDSPSQKTLPTDRSQDIAESTNNEEDLDFLLSLKEPVEISPVGVVPTDRGPLEESKPKILPAATKSIDLEKWLDLVLDD